MVQLVQSGVETLLTDLIYREHTFVSLKRTAESIDVFPGSVQSTGSSLETGKWFGTRD